MNIKKELSLLLLIVFLAGCSPNDGIQSQTTYTIEAVSTYETQEISESVEPGILLITVTPEGKEYTSADNGVTWACDGTECSRPAMFISLFPIQSSISFSASERSVATLHNESAGSLADGRYYTITRYDDGEWVTAEYADKTKSYGWTQELYSFHDRWSMDFYIPLDIYEPIVGKYRLTVPFDGYSCTVEFNAVL